MLATHRDLPLEHDASARYLPWLVAVMVYLATLGLLGALSVNKFVIRWTQGLSGQMTVQVPPSDPAGAVAAHAQRLDRVIAILLKTPGVTSAKVLEPDEIAALLEPWLGAGVRYGELPLPDLIAVTFDPSTKPDFDRLAREIAEAAPGAVVDAHQRWLGQLLDLARSLELVAGLIVALVGFSAVAMVIFTTRMGLAIHANVIELLHLIGAQDAYVAAQFQVHALNLTLRGGSGGALLGAATALIIGRVAGAATDLPELRLGLLDWLLVALLPIAIAAVAMLTARLTVLRTLGRMA